MTIQESNKMIAEFMEAKSNHVKDRYFHESSEYLFELCELEYNYSWDWLMPVVGKISDECEEPEELDGLKYALLTNNIEEAYSFVVDYLENH